MIKFITETFNNREISFAIWLFIIVIFSLIKKDIRISLSNVIKTFFGKKIFSAYLIMSIYVFLLLLILYNLKFWNFNLLKETIFWYLGVAFVSFIYANKVNQNEYYFKNLLKDNLKLIVVLEFITTLYSFSLIIEFFLVPILLFLGMLSAFTEVFQGFRQIKKIIDSLISIVGLCILLFALYKIITSFNSFANEDNLTSFLLAPVLTFLFIPFIYFFALLMSYEMFFVRLGFFIKDKQELKYAKWIILFSFNFRLRHLNKFSQQYYQLNEESNNNIVKSIILFKNNVKQKLEIV